MLGLPRLWLAALGTTALALGGAIAWRAAPEHEHTLQEEDVLPAREAVLEHHLALARADRLYLVLDPGRGSLDLWMGPALLRSWPLRSVAIGTRRALASGRTPDPATLSVLWERARLEPHARRTRRVIVSDQVLPPDPAGAVDWIPPTPEEEVPLPARFVIHFSGGLGVEVRPVSVDSVVTKPGVGDRLRARLARLHPRNWDRLRIRVQMTPEDAGALYRALPEGIPLLFVPGAE